MNSFLLRNEADIQSMRELIKSLPHPPTIEFFEEFIARQSVKDTTRLWTRGGHLVGFAFVDESNNLRFETDPAFPSEKLEKNIIDWCVLCMRKRNADTGREDTLDHSCGPENGQRIAFLEKHGFMLDSVRTLHYTRSLEEPIHEYPLPRGFSIRCAAGEQEVVKLVELHRAAFVTENMTVENRLSIMHAPQYDPALDFVAIAPNGELAAFCICGFEDEKVPEGYTDPIGTHPRYQKIGLGKAIVTAGMLALKRRGAVRVKLGTSSENLPMQRLAETLGFKVESERLWFTKKVA